MTNHTPASADIGFPNHPHTSGRMCRALSDAHGPLRGLLLWFPHEAVLRPGYRAGYANLLRELPPTTQLTMLVHPNARDELHHMLDRTDRRGTTTVVLTNVDLRFTVWARDPCMVLRNGDGTMTFVVPTRFDRQQDGHAVEVVARAIGADVKPEPTCPPGGDVLVGDDFILAGRDARAAVEGPSPRPTPLDDSMARRSRAARHLQALLDPNRRVHLVNPDRPLPSPRTREIRVGGHDVLEILPGGPASRHPLRHLDTFVTLAGRGDDSRYRVLVGSPTLANEVLGWAAGDPALAEHFDNVAEQLVALGFEVIRNPLPLTYGHGRRRIDGVLRDVRLWYVATANNALVQVDPVAGNHVWLPTFGHGQWQELEATDDANRRIWQELGFTVHELTSHHAFAQRFGALRCMTKDLDR